MIMSQQATTQQQQQQFDLQQQQQQTGNGNNQIESKFRIIKTDSSGNHTANSPDHIVIVDSNSLVGQIDESMMNGGGVMIGNVVTHQDINQQQQQQQHSSLNMLGDYQRRGRWLVKDYSPADQLTYNQANSAATNTHHTTNLEDTINTNHHSSMISSCKYL